MNAGVVLGGMPPRVRVRLKYAQLNTVGAIWVTQVFRGNSCFDPDFTGTGGQPYNYDDWSVFYNRYRVIRCSAKLTITNKTSGSFHGTFVAYPSNSSTVAARDDAISAPRSVTKYIGGIYSDSTNANLVIRMSHTTKEILGEDWGDRHEALVSANPADPWFYNIRITADDGATPDVYLRTELVYDVEFFDMNTLTLDEKKLEVFRDSIERKIEKIRVLRSEQDRKDSPALSDDDEKAWSELDTAVQSVRSEGSTRSGLIVEEKPVKPLLRRTVPTQPAQVSSRHLGLSTDKGDRKN
jgi:hypothetical protein